MESHGSTPASLSRQHISFSEDEIEQNYGSFDSDPSDGIVYADNKDSSLKNNFSHLERDLNLLSKEVSNLRIKNQKLKSALRIALHEKDMHIANHAKELSKLTKSQKKIQDELESEKKKYKKEYEKTQQELEKAKRALKKLTVSCESKVREMQKEKDQEREMHNEQLQRKDKEISELISRIKTIESHASQYKSSGCASPNPLYQNTSKRSISLLDSGRYKSCSMDEISEIIVNLEKYHAQLKEQMSLTDRANQQILSNEILKSDLKLSEAKQLQQKLLKSSYKSGNM